MYMKGFIRIILIASVTIASFSQAKHMDEDTIDKRTSPVGKVNIEGMPVATEADNNSMGHEETVIAAEEVVEVTTSTGARAGDAVYNTYCIACHSIGLANAPKAGDSAAWTKLLEVGMDTLVASAVKGKNVMPPNGTCADCSDEELESAITFMSTMNP
ncbi:MAG: cytochrome c5 family protein [Gammaproteobacteria bacterium]|nr:cytochrome c5 family protein [Gammaproteobacteria bacterium]